MRAFPGPCGPEKHARATSLTKKPCIEDEEEITIFRMTFSELEKLAGSVLVKRLLNDRLFYLGFRSGEFCLCKLLLTQSKLAQSTHKSSPNMSPRSRIRPLLRCETLTPSE